MPQVEAVSGREDNAALNEASGDTHAPVGNLADSKGLQSMVASAAFNSEYNFMRARFHACCSYQFCCARGHALQLSHVQWCRLLVSVGDSDTTGNVNKVDADRTATAEQQAHGVDNEDGANHRVNDSIPVVQSGNPMDVDKDEDTAADIGGERSSNVNPSAPPT
eukprot:6176918-Pleurochrysis_carterae.AAC.1